MGNGSLLSPEIPRTYGILGFITVFTTARYSPLF